MLGAQRLLRDALARDEFVQLSVTRLDITVCARELFEVYCKVGAGGGGQGRAGGPWTLLTTLYFI